MDYVGPGQMTRTVHQRIDPTDKQFSETSRQTSDMILYHNGDLVFVATKVHDILLNPLEDQLLIKQAEVVMRRRNVAGNRKAEDVDTIVEADHNDVLVLGEG